MPTPQQVERSRQRNRERGVPREYIQAACAPLTDADRLRIAQESKAGSRFVESGPTLADGPAVVIDQWGGEDPPAA